MFLSRYNALLARCAELGAWRTAVATYQSMDARRASIGGASIKKQENTPFPGPITYQHLLRAAKNARPPQPQAAMSVVREMRERGDLPSAYHYNVVISVCAGAAANAVTRSRAPRLRGRDKKCGPAPAVRNGKGADEATSEDRLPRDVSEGDVGHFSVINVASSGDVSDNEYRDVSAETSPSSKTIDTHSLHVEMKKDGTRKRGLVGEHSIGGGEVINPRGTGSDLGVGAAVSSSRHIAVYPTTPEPKSATDALRLALDVVDDMRDNGVVATEITYKTLVEVCRCAGVGTGFAADEEVMGGGGNETATGRAGESVSPAAIYAALKEAGIPDRYCYDAGVGNAMRGGRCYPAYIAEISR